MSPLHDRVSRELFFLSTHRRKRPLLSPSWRGAPEHSNTEGIPLSERRTPFYAERQRAATGTSAATRPGGVAASRSDRGRPLLLLLTGTVLLLLTAGLLMAQTGIPHAANSSSSQHQPLLPPYAPINTGTLFGSLAVVLVLILFNAFLALAEISLITVRKTRIRQMVEEGNRSAVQIERLLEHPTRLMATIQTGMTLAATFSSTIAATNAVEPLARWLETSGFGVRMSHTVALISVTVPVALLALVIGEIAPKSLAVRHPERFALIAVHPIRWLQVLLTPVVAVLTFMSNAVVRPFGGTAHFTTPAVNEEELKILVEAGEEQGVLEPEETEMIHSILDFGDTVVRKVMTPRIDLTALDVGAPLPNLILLVHQSGHSRIPIYEGDLDNIVGIVHAKDLLALPMDSDRQSVPIRSVMRPPYFIPESKKVAELLKEFRRSKQPLAIVRDEYGVTSGLVTIEDLLEEIVGDIQDEYDKEEPMVQVLDAHTSLLDGRIGLSEVNDRMGLDLPEDEADTIGGFVFGLLGHQAEQNERVQWQHLDFIVEATDGRRITKVRLICHPEKAAPDSQNSVPEESMRPPRTLDENRRSPVETSGVETAPGMHTRS